LAPCPISIVPYIVLRVKVGEDAKDRVREVLVRHQVPFALLGDVLVSCRFAIIFEKTMHYTNESTNTTNYAIVHIDPPKDRVRQAIEFIFNLLREAGLDPRVAVDEVVNEYKGYPIKIVDGKITSGVTSYKEVANKVKEWYKGLSAMFGKQS